MRVIRLALALSLLPLAAQEPAAIAPKDIFLHLTRTIAWYQQLISVDSSEATPEDMVLRNNAQEAGKRVMQSTFKFARAQAAVIDGQSSADSDGTNLQQSLNKATARVDKLQDQLNDLDKAIAQAPPAQRDLLLAQRSAIAANLGLAKEMQSTLKGVTSFSTSKSAKGGLQDQINVLESVNPVAEESADKKVATPASLDDYRPENAGILTLVVKTLALSTTGQHVNALRDQTQRLQTSLSQLREPLRSTVRGIAGESDRIANSSDSAMTRQDWLDAGKQIGDMSSKFKKLANVIAPLSEASQSIQSARAALDEWQNSLDREYGSSLHFLVLRLSVLIGGILLLLLASAIWQRAILRYVHEPRRRRQFLVAKRLVMSAALALLVTLSLFSNFSSVATLLGFATAGLALALQNVILSAVAYFFLVGRYGLRVGDRVTIQGVTGQVIEVGLIRLFLMELTGNGADMHPTGRVAVFANSVIFQPSALMRQAPGLNYAWHAVAATLQEPVDVATARERLVSAVEKIYAGYKDAIERQQAAFEKSTDMQTASPTPVSRTQFTDHGYEVVVRYPVLIEEPGQIDERIVDSIVNEAEKDPKLAFAAGGSPKVTPAV